jgi:glycine cleavage system H lipoate-binding protein
MVAIFVAITFILFLVVDYFILRAQRKEHPAFTTMPVFDKHSIFFPAAYLLSRGHLWLKSWKEGAYRLGVDEFLVRALKSIRVTDLAAEGMEVKKGDVLIAGIAGNNKIQLRAPMDGTVLTVNKNLIGKLVEDPYNDDWGVALLPAAPIESNLFRTKEKASAWISEEFRRLKDFLNVHSAEPGLVGLTMADGGNIVEGALAQFSQETIHQFENDFLTQ